MNKTILKTLPSPQFHHTDGYVAAPIVRIEQIKPFINVCKVTGEQEHMNIEITYVPKDNIIELGSYREFFEQGFNDYVEKLAMDFFNILDEKIKPHQLSVRVYLVEASLTPWSVTVNTNEAWGYNR
jgi:NADPH-dependent 7-cyano-7-deazaguanine reductase QueF